MSAKTVGVLCWLAALLALAYAVAATAQVVMLGHPLDWVVLGIWGVAVFWVACGVWAWRQGARVR